MSLINVQNLTFSYDGSYDNIFENVSFRIDTNWKTGFIAENGMGKTTFLNLLMSKYTYSGNISANVCFEYFPCDVREKDIFTIDAVRELCPGAADWEIMREFSLMQLSEDVPYSLFETLSGGEQTKVLLAALFLRENAFLLIDEPTNHLDTNARQAVGEYLKRKNGFILVSHDRSLLDACTDHILSISSRGIEVQNGNFSSWLENKRIRDKFELNENEKLKKEITRLNAASEKNVSWSNKSEKSKKGHLNSGLKVDRGYVGHKSAKMMKRAKTIENRISLALEKKAALLTDIDSHDTLKLSPLTFHTNQLITAEKLSIYYGDKIVCKDISFVIHQGERIALSGANGCGKSSILKLLCGENISYTGGLYMNNQLKISYIPQSIADLSGSLSLYAEDYGIDESLFKGILRKLGFSRIQFEKDISDYSAGQKKKVMLARSLCEKAHLYIWDEPLNYIDVISRMQIEELILSFKPTLLFVEHDSTFCSTVSNNIIDMN